MLNTSQNEAWYRTTLVWKRLKNELLLCVRILSMEYKDYYKILGVGKKATQDEIKKSYRKLAAEFHPDLNPGNKKAEEKFKEINEAYEVLGDEARRYQYDALGNSWNPFSSGASNSGPSYSNTNYGSGPGGGFNNPNINEVFGGQFEGFSDFFKSIFGGRESSANETLDYRAAFTIRLAEAYTGCIKSITVNGKAHKITIKPGIPDGQILKLKGEGNTRGNQTGDLYLKINVLHDPNFERKGNDLHTTLTIDLLTAILGGEANFTTLSGQNIKIKIQAGTQPGSDVRIKDKGMPLYNQTNMFGNLYLKIKVVIPTQLSPEEKKLYQELEQLKKVTI